MIIYNENGFALSLDGEMTRFTDGLKVSVNTNISNTPIDLTFKSLESKSLTDKLGDYNEVIALYSEETEKISVCVILKSYQQFTIGQIKAEIKNPSEFCSQTSFAYKNGVVLNFKSSENIEGIMANYQHKDWWTRPFFSKKLEEVPTRTQSVLWKTDTGYYHLLPVVDETFRTEVSGSHDGLFLEVSAHQGGMVSCETFSFIISQGENPYLLVEQNVKGALAELGYPTKHREDKDYPEILDYLGWCSWDAFYHKVDEKGLLEKAAELNELGLPVGWVMIDDGWSEIKDNKLYAFEAEPEKFPKGLGNTVDVLKNKYRIKHVGVWHTIAGYWGGDPPRK